jgi:hypothetical protein
MKPHKGAERQPIYKLARSGGPPDVRFVTNDYVTDRKPVFTFTHRALYKPFTAEQKNWQNAAN